MEEKSKQHNSQIAFSSFSELNPNPIIEVSLSGKIEYANAVVSKLFPDLPSLGIKHPFLKDYNSFVISFLSGAMSSFSREIKIGDYWYNQVLYFVSERKVVNIFSFNITENKLNEEKLKESEEKYHKLIETSDDAILLADIETGVIIDVNRKAQELTGMSFGELVGMKYTELHPPEDLSIIREMFQEVVSKQRFTVVNKKIFLNHKSGKKIRVSLSGSVIELKGRKIAQGVFRDMSLLEEMENAIKSSELKFRELFERIHNGVCVYKAINNGEDFIIQDFNHAAEVIDQIKREDVVNKSVIECFPGVKRFGLFDVFKRVWLTGAAERLAVSFYKDNRISGWRENYVYKLPISGEIVAVYSDVTEQKIAEAALKESEEKNRLIVENIPIHLSATDDSGKLVIWNEYAEKTLGFSKEEVVKKLSPADFLENKEYLNEIARIAVENGVFEREVNLRHKNGSFIPFRMVVVPYFKEGKMVGLYGFGEDVRERKEAGFALAESKNKFEALFEASPNGVYLCNLDGRIVECNSAAEKLTSYAKNELLNLSMKDLIPEGVVFNLKDIAVSGTLKGEYIGEVLNKKKTQEIFPVEIIIKSVEVNNQKMALVVVRDISEHKKAEAILKENEERLRIIADFTYDWEYWQAPDNKIIYVSPSCEIITGFSPNEFLGNSNLLFDIVHPDDKEKFKEHFQEAFSQGEVKKIDFRVVTKDKKERWIGHICQPVYDKQGQFLGRRVSNRDISEIKFAEAALNKAREDLEMRIQRRTSELAKINVDLKDEIIEHKNAQKEITALKKQIEFILGATKTGLDIIDSEYNIRYIDPEWAKVYGDPKGKKCYEYFMGKDSVCHECGIEEAFRTKKTVVKEEILVKEGNRPIQVTTIPYQDEHGNWFVAEVNVDISERKKAEEEIFKAQNRYSQLINNLNVGVYRNTPGERGNFIEVNPAMVAMFEASSREELLKTSVSTLYQDPKQRMQFSEKLMRLGSLSNVELELITLKGRKFFVSITAVRKKDEFGNIYFDGVAEDITDRKHIEELLRQSQERYQRIISSITDYIYTVRIEKGQVVNTVHSPNCLKVTGYSEEEFFADPYLWIKIVPDEDKALVKETAMRILKGEKVLSFEHRIIRKDNTVCWVRNNPVPVYNEEGVLIGYDGVIQDITDRINAEYERARAETIESIIENSPDSIIVTDLEGKILQFNKVLTEHFGVRNEIIGRFVTDYVSDIFKPKIIYALKECFEKGHFRNLELATANRKIPLSADISLMRNSKGEPKGFIAIVVDISERKHLERLKEEFFNSASHELRNPLFAIKEAIALVADGTSGEINEKQKNLLNSARANIERLAKFASTILDYQKLDYKMSAINLVETDINTLIQHVKETVVISANNKGLSLLLDLETHLPLIHIDADKITQVLLNLVTNAIKFTDKGTIKISSKSEDDNIIVSVEDSGIGIKEEDLPKLFDAFSQIISGKPNKYGGSGLGLVISKNIIERHGGKIWVESVYNKGSKFSFSLTIF